MSDQPELISRHLEELERLIDAHLERGALDEGNATVFDSIIDAWLGEELARVDDAMVTSTTDAASRKAVADAERELRDERERAVDVRWEHVSREHQLARAEARDAVIARHDANVRAAEDRLDLARTQLETARELLLGAAPATTPVDCSCEERRLRP